MSALVTVRPPARAVALGVLRTLRPDHWIKNVLVVVAPLAAGRLLEPGVLGPVLLAFAGFCLAASAVYCVNDVCDAACDAAHPVKRLRPVASGLVGPRLAIAAAVPLAAAAVLLQTTAGARRVIALYLLLNVGYALWLKRRPLVESAIVASGFLLRPLGGGAATGITVSCWLLLVCAGGALFMVAGKRLSEQLKLGRLMLETRPMTGRYTRSRMRLVMAGSAVVAAVAYVGWTVDASRRGGAPWAALSTVPVALALARYGRLIRAGRAERPERLVLRDRVLPVLGLLWLAAFALAAHR